MSIKTSSELMASSVPKLGNEHPLLCILSAKTVPRSVSSQLLHELDRSDLLRASQVNHAFHQVFKEAYEWRLFEEKVTRYTTLKVPNVLVEASWEVRGNRDALDALLAAHDRFVAWKYLASEYQLDGFPELRDIKDIDAYIACSEGFSEWIVRSKDQIGQVQSIDLKGQGLTTIPKELFQLGHVACLNVSENQIRSIPHELGACRQLSHFNGNDNLIEAIPPEIGQLSQLGILLLGSNRIRKIPPKIGELRELKVLSLSGNPLELGTHVALCTRQIAHFHTDNPSELLIIQRVLSRMGVAGVCATYLVGLLWLRYYAVHPK